jgi:hypothetical protein
MRFRVLCVISLSSLQLERAAQLVGDLAQDAFHAHACASYLCAAEIGYELHCILLLCLRYRCSTLLGPGSRGDAPKNGQHGSCTQLRACGTDGMPHARSAGWALLSNT